MTLEELKKGEHVTVEYKLDIPQEREKYLKSAVAFANGAGGKLVFGVKNQTWDVIGFPDDELFQKYDAIANSIYDACTPSLVPVMEIEEVDGKKIIVANILPGMDKPYYLRADAGTVFRAPDALAVRRSRSCAIVSQERTRAHLRAVLRGQACPPCAP